MVTPFFMNRLINADKDSSFPAVKVAYDQDDASFVLRRSLFEVLTQLPISKQAVIVCIGTDRSTGDCLGPLIGSKLSGYHGNPLPIFGTLDQPVHAVNLQDTIEQIRSGFDDPFLIAIDACLGQVSSVGHIQIAQGPVKPGAGVHKDLPAVGDMHITGIVNVGGFMEYFVLQNTRLNLVMRMAEIVAQSLYYAAKNAHHAANAAIQSDESLLFPRV